MPYTILSTPITTGHYVAHANARRAVVIHATAGTFPGDHTWLLKGGDPRRPISCHYLITKTGLIYRYLPDDAVAWHAGESAWAIDGTRRSGLNAWAIGIELSNRNDGRDPYPEAQVAAAIWLTARLMREYAIPLQQIVRHRDISPGRKTDPLGLDWLAFLTALGDAPTRTYTIDAPLLAASPITDYAPIVAKIASRATRYTLEAIRDEIVPGYINAAKATGIDPIIALAQMCHETGVLTSFWSARPQRNPAGIGVTGWASPFWLPGFHFNPDRGAWEQGIVFDRWKPTAIDAHVGRLAAYAIAAGKETNDQQRAIIAHALRVRGMPRRLRGSAPTLRGLNGTWATGEGYAQAIAAAANWLLRGA